MGNEGVDRLAEQGRLSLPYNETRRAKRVAPDDQVFTRQDTDLPSHCSWVLTEYGDSLVEGGDENSCNSSLSVRSVDSSEPKELMSEYDSDSEVASGDGSSEDEYERFLSQFLWDDGPLPEKRRKG